MKRRAAPSPRVLEALTRRSPGPVESAAPVVESGRRLQVLALAENATDRAAVNTALQAMNDTDIVVTIRESLQALASLRELRPHVVLLSLQDEGMDPLQLTKDIRLHHPQLPVVLFSGRTDPTLASRALRAGAQGYLLQDELPRDLARALREVGRGGRFVSEQVMQGILHNLSEPPEEEVGALIDHLSDRELIVFQLIGQGHAAARIAAELHLSTKTVATHRANIKRKMHLTDNAQLKDAAAEWARHNLQLNA